ncbi:MAG: type I restriction enzyme HsdR N-terminal domain-containing protein [Clostridia bacterium]|nr:type I restriction enzyme HsdR N-terminal domain-containing protein [Clostridia bacterium]
MLEEKLKSFAGRVDALKGNIFTEEATKTSLIMPFFSILGYDVFNPLEFVPEFTADVGIKKGEKVDYAIFLNNEPTILIEAKSVNEKLEKHDSQLFRYFGTTKAKFAILTNGVIYKFYTDLEEPNKMDSSPFLTISLEDLRDSDVAELKKFEKNAFDINNIINTASDLKYCGLIKQFLKAEFACPSDDFTKLILSADIYDGRFTQNILERFKPIVKKSISQYINELVNDKIKNALNIEEEKTPEGEVVEELPECEETNGVVTTEEEMQAYYIIKSILCKTTDLDRIAYKDTASYFGVLLDGKVTKWICRIFLKEKVKYVIIPNDTENVKYTIESIEDLYKFSDKLKARILKLL